MRTTASILRNATTPLDSGISRRHSDSGEFGLPVAPTSFVGREDEVEHLSAQLLRSDTRLVTLIGPGGAGKTRLALRVAETVSEEFERGVLFVPLAAVDDPALVAAAIGSAFGLSDSGDHMLADRISSVLAGQTQLLVLDNFERLVAVAPLLVNLLSTCPTLTILATSRVVLHVSVEREFPVQPLDLPRPQASFNQISTSSAVRLFMERSHSLDINAFEDQTADVAAICRRLDGLPLAIELAAAKTRVLSTTELLSRLDQRLSLLTDGPRDAPPRLQSMRDAVAWSYDLLGSDDQALFRALSVFDGGFTLAAAEAIAPPSMTISAVQSLTTLIDHSLVQRTDVGTGQPRFTMLETIRGFGNELLIEQGEEDAIRERHLAWFIGQLDSPSPEQWSVVHGLPPFLLPNEQDNLRSALNWALDRGEIASAAQIAWGLLPFWLRTGLYPEAEATLSRIVDLAGSLDPILIVGVMIRASLFAYLIGDLSRCRVLASRALEICRAEEFPIGIRVATSQLALVTRWANGPEGIRLHTEAIAIGQALEDVRLIASDLGQRAITFMLIGERQRAKDDLDEALSLLQGLPNSKASLVIALATAGWIAVSEHRIDAAEQFGRESQAISNEFGIRQGQVFSSRVLGEVAFARGNYALAAEQFQRALRLVIQRTTPHVEGFLFAELALVAQTQGDWERAARLYGAAESSWDRQAFSDSTRVHMSTWSSGYDPFRERLGDDRFAAAYATGQMLTPAEVYAEAMAVTVAPRGKTVDNSGLSPRAIEVLNLVANGLTNREIAAALYVSKRTIDSHLVSIFAKLGVYSRRAAVATARERGLLASAEVVSSSSPAIPR
jgi:predicted ATPase/DNA-binding CsgD family transcriptional regulator